MPADMDKYMPWVTFGGFLILVAISFLVDPGPVEQRPLHGKLAVVPITSPFCIEGEDGPVYWVKTIRASRNAPFEDEYWVSFEITANPQNPTLAPGIDFGNVMLHRHDPNTDQDHLGVEGDLILPQDETGEKVQRLTVIFHSKLFSFSGEHWLEIDHKLLVKADLSERKMKRGLDGSLERRFPYEEGPVVDCSRPTAPINGITPKN